jgi:hypothetical protein
VADRLISTADAETQSAPTPVLARGTLLGIFAMLPATLDPRARMVILRDAGKKCC